MQISKKNCIIFIIFCFLFAFLIFLNESFNFKKFVCEYGCEHLFFVRDENSNAEYAGLFYISKAEEKNESIKGEFTKLNDWVSLFEIKQFFNAQIIDVESFNNIKIIYLKSNLLKKEIKTKTKTFNLQVIVSDETNVYYPINFGSF